MPVIIKKEKNKIRNKSKYTYKTHTQNKRLKKTVTLRI